MKKSDIVFVLGIVFVLISLFFTGIYAFADNLSYYYGDVNFDGNVTAADARTILRVSASIEQIDSAAIKIADIDEDGHITAYDARTTLRCAAKLERLKPYFNMEELSSEESEIYTEEHTASDITETVSEIESERETEMTTTNGEDCIHFLPTGSSDAILIESNGHFALVDAAEDTDNPRGFAELVFEGQEEKVLTYLKNNSMSPDGNVHLDFIVGTHAHSDHIGGFDTIIEDKHVVIDKAFLKEYDSSHISDYEVEHWDNREVYDQMINALNARNIPIISDIPDTSFSLGDFTITLLNTKDTFAEGEKVGENDQSLGVLIEKNGTRVFLAGDINNYSGDETRLENQIGKIDLLKVGHHGYSGSTSEDWLKTLMPTTCVITNEEQYPDSQTIERIKSIAGSEIFYTGKERGVVAKIIDNGNIEYESNIL